MSIVLSCGIFPRDFGTFRNGLPQFSDKHLNLFRSNNRSIERYLVMLIETIKSRERPKLSSRRQSVLQDERLGPGSAGRKYFGFHPCSFFLVSLSVKVRTAAAALSVASEVVASSVD